jgi:hypothetical protein
MQDFCYTFMLAFLANLFSGLMVGLIISIYGTILINKKIEKRRIEEDQKNEKTRIFFQQFYILKPLTDEIDKITNFLDTCLIKHEMKLPRYYFWNLLKVGGDLPRYIPNDLLSIIADFYIDIEELKGICEKISVNQELTNTYFEYLEKLIEKGERTTNTINKKNVEAIRTGQIIQSES